MVSVRIYYSKRFEERAREAKRTLAQHGIIAMLVEVSEDTFEIWMPWGRVSDAQDALWFLRHVATHPKQ